jgi:hypothetical protein
MDIHGVGQIDNLHRFTFAGTLTVSGRLLAYKQFSGTGNGAQ